MTKEQQELIERAIACGGRATIFQDWGRKPNGGFIRGSNTRKLKTLQFLIDAGMVNYSRFPANPDQQMSRISNGYTAYTVEHNYTLTNHGRAAYDQFKKATS